MRTEHIIIFFINEKYYHLYIHDINFFLHKIITYMHIDRFLAVIIKVNTELYCIFARMCGKSERIEQMFLFQ